MSDIVDIDRIRDELRSLPVYQDRLKSLNEQIRGAENALAELLRSYQEESLDVEKLQQETLSTYLLQLIGKYEDRMAKELREELAAKTAYDEAFVRLEELRREAVEAKARIDALQRTERQYKTELEARRKALRSRLSQPDGQAYRRLEEERRFLLRQATEIDEAANVASRAVQAAREVQESLRDAESWATYDLVAKGGIFTHMAKYSHIDHAEAVSNQLNSLLHSLQSELADVRDLSVHGFFAISSDERMLDYWFDNIFTDLSVHSQIQENRKNAERTMQSIHQVLDALGNKRREVDARIAENSRREEELLLRMR